MKSASFESVEVAGELVAAGLTLSSHAGRLRYAGPAGALTDALRTRALASREALVERLVDAQCMLTPPSATQARIYAANALTFAPGAYLVPLAWRIEGSFDAERALACARALAARHDALRQAFQRVGGHLVAVVSAHVEPDFAALSAWTHGGEVSVDPVRAALDAEATRPFDVASAPLWRIRVVHGRDGNCHLLWVLHHLVCDEYASAQLVDEFARLYRAGESQVPARSVAAYREYVLWQRARWTHADTVDRLDTCLRRLRGTISDTTLPLRASPQVADRAAACVSLVLRREVGAAVERAARALRVTEFSYLLASFTMLLAYYQRGPAVAVVIPVTARLDDRFLDVIGPAQQLAVIAATIDGDRTFATLCEEIAAQVQEAFEPDYPPIEAVLSGLATGGGGKRAALPEVMFVKAAPARALALDDVGCAPVPLRNAHAKTTLLACTSRDGDALRLTFEYRPSLIEPRITQCLLDDYAALIERCSGDASTSRRQLSDALAQRCRASLRPAPTTRSIVDRFDEAVHARPNGLALRGACDVTYASLSRFADRIRARLPDSARDERRACVAVWGRMSARMIAAMLALMRAGHGIAPFDASLPAQRIAAVCRRDRIGTVLLCDSDLSEHAAVVAADASVRIVAIDNEMPETATASDTGTQPRLAGAASAPLHPESLAYVMYTSGSTGEPKGVCVSHRAFDAFVQWAVRALDLRRLNGFNVLTHASFDVSLFEVFAPLAAGCPLFLDDGGNYRDRLRAAGRGGIAAVPSVLHAALASDGFPAAATHLFVAGEPFSPALGALLAAVAPQLQVWNLYGPTEAVIYASASRIDGKNDVSIGVPRDGLRCYVLREDWTLLPKGGVGELAIGGLVAREYLGMPSLTAMRFVPDPFAPEPGARMYLTGDLARVDGNGQLEYVGRRDRQIKHFGVRIEPEEVERVLVAHPVVTAAVVQLDRSTSGGALLVAAVEAPDRPDLEHSLRQHCHARLPRAMTPQRFIRFDALPRTPAGKLDAAALASRPEWHTVAPDETRSDRSSMTETERMLSAIWTAALGHEQFDVHTNFFEAGGHSLALLAVHDGLARMCAAPPPLIDLFAYPTIAQLADRLDPRRRIALEDRWDAAARRAANQRTARLRHRMKHGKDGAA
ncbi:AMP-binding protein [Paraburkholderia caledonica]|uniref:Amino acid adenylation domain-containing protein n=1 Tax=Paraburkholderia caledonica TaxID=134536 RepID=A0AB73IHY4_9BURK|nr:amino acid adenylation domain-containing protein [Paraburkholderia caledonica]